MAGKAATVMAVGWMSVCGGLALATMDNGLWRTMSGHSSVHYSTDAPYLTTRPRVAGQIEGRPRSSHGPIGSIAVCACWRPCRSR